MQTELINALNIVLKQFPEYWEADKLHRTMVIEDIQNKKPELIKAFIQNEKIKSLYGIDIGGVLVFDFNGLISILKYKEYWADSFTKYRNKIGLTTDGRYLEYNSDVVLDFPYKDCVLEGGMSTEEQGKNEIYYNEIIAKDEIDRLFGPKVLTNAKRYNKDGVEESITNFNDEDNLIIKGNNLIALHSLKQRYAGKVKLIYIDPPYNTGNDGFKYNDRFSRSTWLTFMKNRLEVARELLSDDGVIFVQCDDNQQAYLVILMDSIFGQTNKINVISVKMSEATGVKMSHADKRFPKLKEYILFYKKENLTFLNPVKIPIDAWNNEYKEIILNVNKDDLETIKEIMEKNKSTIDEVNLVNEIVSLANIKSLSSYFNENDISKDQQDKFKWENSWRIIQAVGAGSIKERAINARTNNEISALLTSTGKLNIFKNNFDETSKDPRIRIIFADKYLEYNPGDFWTDIKTAGGVGKEGGVLFPKGKKPEQLLQRIINSVTLSNDIILDFHLGSGTTAAVAHKMGRRYIGVEQMDYIADITVPRLQKVIEGEQGGISKDVSWQGGGSFVYAELKKLNYEFADVIDAATTSDDLKIIYEEMRQKAHLNYQVELDGILNKVYEVDGVDHFLSFNELDLQEQKKLLIELLDKNQLYVNASEMEDKQLNFSMEEKAFTASFYKKD
ncbi:site-specific DNA-methyltransferase [Bartonella sp. HY038]|uniref:site-specific DNA-methyltransferase n=1 Tax=Bartonella sp. HY038 TaxID=2759660 RepID=UPI0015FE338A|nr:site-specific DNA-methyltransferase [Bartonella sp. HY038]